MTGAFFEPQGEGFVATELTRGPWSAELSHGGPPAALLARAMERLLAAEGPLHAARVTLDLVRPVSLGPVSVSAEVVRSGRSAKLASAVLRGKDGKELIRASGLFFRQKETPLVARGVTAASIPGPEGARPMVFPFSTAPVGYQSATEWRIARGDFGEGAMTAWIRMRHPLLPGEEPTPLQRVLLAADSGNGVSFGVDPRRFTFLNADLTIHLDRLPAGEWVGLDAHTRAHRNGVGLAESALHDEKGVIGRAVQSLLIEERP
jgi:acyl-coenzyme A thioesterase PaaI-like protein